MKELLKLFWVFAKMGAVTFGGGYAMLPILTREVVEKQGWASEAELLDYYAVGQCTPGIIAVNTATFIGYKQKGVLGGIFATLGLISPSLIIITLIAALLKNFSHIEAVRHAFNGIRAAVCALIVSAVIKLSKSALTDGFSVIVCLAVFGFMLILDPSPIIAVAASALAGYVYGRVKKA